MIMIILNLIIVLIIINPHESTQPLAGSHAVAQAHQPPPGRGGAGDAAAPARGGAPRRGRCRAEGGEGHAAERGAAQRPGDGWGWG